MEEQEPERYYDWMLWKMRKEECKLKDLLMSPMEAARRIVALEKRISELEEALRAERTSEINNDWPNNDIHYGNVFVYTRETIAG